MILADYSFDDLRNLIIELNEKPYRATQIFSNVANGKAISEMSDIPKSLKERLLENFSDSALEIIEELTSKDGTKKFLYKLNDGNIIEGVLMCYNYGNTLCVSTQVGCRMGCAFCASTLQGLIRNLTPGEILSQILVVNRRLGGNITDRKITNVVLMGSGEPLDNYDNVIKFLALMSDKRGINISPRNLSLSTCGLVPQMLKLAQEGFPVNLTLSLHNPFDNKRQQIMPVAKAYTVRETVDALDKYFKATGRRYYIEYSLISGENDTEQCALELKKLFTSKPCHINLIRLNSVMERNLVGTSDRDAKAFMERLEKLGLSVTLRRKMGNDIEGACGQLRRKFIEKGGDFNEGQSN